MELDRSWGSFLNLLPTKGLAIVGKVDHGVLKNDLSENQRGSENPLLRSLLPEFSCGRLDLGALNVLGEMRMTWGQREEVSKEMISCVFASLF